ncbi:MAG: MerR family transcriptional regulator [Propionibacteriaceae bacterium]|nr:MerR family transcriptional regulator [Propionibacteriaceae bacterium]
MFRIGEFSKLGKVTVKTMHHYDEVGLLEPAFVDPVNGYRYYTVEQLGRLAKIVALRGIGFALPDVAALLDGRDVDQLLERRRAELADERLMLDHRLHSLNRYINEQGSNLMLYQPIVKTLKACTVFSYDTVIAEYSDLMKLIPEVGERVAKANPGLECTPDDYCFTCYLDEEHRDHDIHVEICQSVVQPGVDADGIVFKQLPETQAISVTHLGGYDGLGEAYAALAKAVEDGGWKPAGPAREWYIDGIWNKDDVADWKTEIQAPVVKG